MLLPLLTLALLAAPEPPVCTLLAFDFQREDERSYFVAVPQADTSLAGMGDTRLGMFPEAPRPGALPTRPVFGQVALVAQLGGRDSAALQEAFAAQESRRAVLVPWDFDAGCRPAVWRRSARWARLGEPGFFVARLREPAYWAGGLPTFDVFFAGRYPYPTGSFFAEEAPLREPALTAGEYFELYRALPARRTPYAHRREAGQRLWEWARENPGVATKPLAASILEEVRRHHGWSEADVRAFLAAPAVEATGSQ